MNGKEVLEMNMEEILAEINLPPIHRNLNDILLIKIAQYLEIIAYKKSGD